MLVRNLSIAHVVSHFKDYLPPFLDSLVSQRHPFRHTLYGAVILLVLCQHSTRSRYLPIADTEEEHIFDSTSLQIPVRVIY